MSSAQPKPAVPRPRSRRSLAQIPQTGSAVGLDKENLTTDVGAIGGHKREKQRNPMNDKKLRSKSLGPGGLDALKNAAGNRRQSTAGFPLKSILKPTVPVSPPRNIPSFEESRKKTPARRSPRKSIAGKPRQSLGGNNLLIDFSTPASGPAAGSVNPTNPFDSFDPFSDRRGGNASEQTEDERQKRESEEKERREREKQAILQQREARRKSMANRRVSFAPEATLHTWNVVEFAEEYTSSSASTNSTRRVSGAANETRESRPAANEPNTSNDENQIRHDSGAAQTTNDEAFSSSPLSGSSVAESEESPSAGLAPANDDASFSGSEDGESTAMSMDNMTARSMSSRSEGTTTDSLDRSLRQAAKTAGTRGIEYDEHEDLDAEYTNHEIAGAFKPWIKKGERLSFGDLSSHLDQENVNPFSAKKPLSSDNPKDSLGNDMLGGVSRRGTLGNASVFGGETMEFTNVVGGIVDGFSPSKDFSGESETAGDEDMTMEFTSVFGGVLPKNSSPVRDPNRDPDPYAQTDGRSPATLYPDLSEEGEGEGESESEIMEMEMEMTSAVGGILPPIEEHTEPLEDDTMGMDMTSAVGKILTPVRGQARSRGLLFEEPEPNEPESSPFQEQVAPSPVKPGSGRQMAAVASENGSPSLRVNPRRSLGSRKSTTPTRPSPRPPTAPRTPTTPRRQSPQKTGPKTPAKTPPSRKSRPVSASPKKPTRLSQTKVSQSPGTLFRQDAQTGQSTPSFVLRPPVQASLGVGIYKEGLGSPRVAELLDRRRSIGDDAEAFVPGNQRGFGVRFESPRAFDKEVDELQSPHQAIAEEQSTHLTEKDPVLNLREMIASLTPKKNKLKGRKSLHVGSAMGLLGKRPAELDDEEEELDHTPKRLKGREASPVKGIKLPAPPSKAETVGRVSRLSFKPVPEFTPQIQISTTPKGPYRHKDVSDAPVANQHNSGEMPAKPAPDDGLQAHADSAVKPIQLSDFLEMTNIHFMELTTTKRRHTLAPDNIGKRRLTESTANGPPKDIGLEDCVAAGFCTLPMLELYQHSCRELKSYISEGRRIIRSIETETYEDNPPLFREYVTAPPDIRILMDNQFRNVKTHARLLSKAMWYEWRMKLLEGLKQGLDRHVEEMKSDDALLSKKEVLLQNVMPKLVRKQATLREDARNLERVVDDMENCDQEELRDSRAKLLAADAAILEKRKQLEEMKALLRVKTDILENGADAKSQLMQQIDEADRIREECRGWSIKEVHKLKRSVDSIEKRTGWAVVSVTSTANSSQMMAMSYRKELRLDINPKAFSTTQAKSARRSSKPSADLQLALTYVPEISRGVKSGSNIAPPAEKGLLLHALRARLSQVAPGATSQPKALLASISKTWDTACSLQNEIRLLEYCGVTRRKMTESKQSEPTPLIVRCILLGRLPTTKTEEGEREAENSSPSRLDIDFTVKPRLWADDGTSQSSNTDIDIDVDISVCKVYGFQHDAEHSARFSEAKIRDYLHKVIQSSPGVQFGNGLWLDAVKSLEKKLFMQ